MCGNRHSSFSAKLLLCGVQLIYSRGELGLCFLVFLVAVVPLS